MISIGSIRGGSRSRSRYRRNWSRIKSQSRSRKQEQSRSLLCNAIQFCQQCASADFPHNMHVMYVRGQAASQTKKTRKTSGSTPESRISLISTNEGESPPTAGCLNLLSDIFVKLSWPASLHVSVRNPSVHHCYVTPRVSTSLLRDSQGQYITVT